VKLTEAFLHRIDFKGLERWCRTRQLTWTAASQAAPAILLAPQETGRMWQRLVLVMANPDCRLENEAGDVLAIASSVTALLDAVDGGVADAPAAAAGGPSAVTCSLAA
jgi:hypothetical protein